MRRCCWQLVCGLSLLALLVSCGRDVPRDPRTLVRLSVAGPETLDPHLVQDPVGRAVAADMFEGLYRLDGAGEPVLAMADDVVVSEDGLTWTFSLRGALWSDGEPVTATDFVFGFRRALRGQLNASDAPLLFSIDGAQAFAAGDDNVALGVEAFNDQTLVMRLAHVSPDLPAILARPIAVPAPDHALGDFDPEWMGPANVVVNGPYVPDVRAVADDEARPQMLRLARNPLHRDATCFTQVIYETARSHDAGIRAVASGQGDVFVASGYRIAPGADDLDLTVNASGALLVLSPNAQFPPFDDVRVRRAIALAVDAEALSQEVFAGASSVASRLWLGGEAPLGDGGDQSSVMVDYATLSMGQRRAEAVEQLLAVGFNDGRPLRMKFSYPDTPMGQAVAEMVAQDIENIADWVVVDVVAVPLAAHRSDLAAGAYQFALDLWVPEDVSQASTLQRFLPWAISRNASNWNDVAFTGLYLEAMGTPGGGEGREALFRRAEQMVLNAAGVIPLLEVYPQRVVNPRVLGLEGNRFGPPSRLLCWASKDDGGSALRP